jgi:hypothetical protein
MKEISKDFVETAHTTKPSGERDLGHWKSGFMQELFGE